MQVDPEAARIIDPLNVRRTIRALEVFRLTGEKFSSQRGTADIPYRLLTIGLTRPRPELYARVDARIESMFSAGLLDEVQNLIDLASLLTCLACLPSGIVNVSQFYRGN